MAEEIGFDKIDFDFEFGIELFDRCENVGCFFY